jgi:hypothetical protein
LDEGFILAQHNQQLFGALTYKSAQFNLPFAVGLRSSYKRYNSNIKGFPYNKK